MYKRVLIPLDGSAVAETVLPLIVQIAGPLDFDAVLLRVIPALPKAASAVTEAEADVARIDAEEYLAPIAVELRNKGVRVQTRVRRGAPAEEIVATAREEGADLVAMTTHGRSGLRRAAFGSVADAVLRDAAMPVFLIRATAADVTKRQSRPVTT